VRADCRVRCRTLLFLAMVLYIVVLPEVAP
jgi:hypothetical protein